ncbi:hypothetical protein NE865_04212 [Phthorimaea operculella]|nr:hypothetical protein NE865_04212 [Phthorimaea operculella]
MWVLRSERARRGGSALARGLERTVRLCVREPRANDVAAATSGAGSGGPAAQPSAAATTYSGRRKFFLELFLEDKLEELQLGSRKTNFELKNVPRKDDEDKESLIAMVTCLSEAVDCKMDRSDIKDIYRVRGKNPEQKNTPIIVETNSVLLKTDLIKKVKTYNIKNKSKICAKHLGYKTQEDTPVYLSEHLTAKAARLHFLARDLAKSKAYRFCWTAYGKVYVRKNEQSRIIQIKTEQQVHHLLSET